MCNMAASNMVTKYMDTYIEHVNPSIDMQNACNQHNCAANQELVSKETIPAGMIMSANTAFQ